MGSGKRYPPLSMYIYNAACMGCQAKFVFFVILLQGADIVDYLMP